jgi:hypothetical protein
MGGHHDRKHRSSSRRDDEEEHESRHRKRHHDDSEEEHGHRHRGDRHDDSEEEDHSRSHKKKKKRSSRGDDDDDKHKRKHRRKHRGDSDDDDDNHDNDDHKRERKHRSKDKKRDNEKRRHREKKEKKDKKQKRHKGEPPDKSRLYPMGQVLGRKPDTSIDPVDDYFTFHEHFWVYLYREEGVAFNDMTAEEARKSFELFAKEYNAGNLEAEYYTAKMPAPVLEESKTTKHSWSFNNNMTDNERKGLQTLQEGIWKQTEYNSKEGPPQNLFGQTATGDFKGAASAPSDAPNFAKKTPEERLDDRRANKRLRGHVRNVQEELHGGPKDFRERQLEKKRQHADRIHGAARGKNDAGIEMSDTALYGGDANNNQYQASLARERARKAKRTDARATRIQELQEKDKGRQEKMVQMLGLKNLEPGQKFTIAPRKDG